MKIVPMSSDRMPALTVRRTVPIPQSIRYRRPSTIRRLEGSERSLRRGGPPAVPRKRICVPCMGSAVRLGCALAARKISVSANADTAGCNPILRDNRRNLEIICFRTPALTDSVFIQRRSGKESKRTLPEASGKQNTVLPGAQMLVPVSRGVRGTPSFESGANRYGLIEHLLDAAEGLAGAFLIFDEGEADVAVAVVAEADAGADGDFGFS